MILFPLSCLAKARQVWMLPGVVLIMMLQIGFVGAKELFSCEPCQELYYELHLNFSGTSCEFGADQPDNNKPGLQTTCFGWPTAKTNRATFFDFGDEDVKAITQLDFWELDANMDVRHQAQYAALHLTAGQSMLYQSAIPGQAYGVQILATAVDSKEQRVVRSWTIYFKGSRGNESDDLCLPTSSTAVAGWSKTRLLCTRRVSNPPIPLRTLAPVRRRTSRSMAMRRVRNRMK